MEKVLVATNNQNKLSEFKLILKDYEIISLKEAGIEADLDELGETFVANATMKASAVNDFIYQRDGKHFDGIIIADDTGLMVDALGGFPGIKTRRFLGEDVSDEERNNFIINKLNEIEGCNRGAEMCTCIALIKNDEIIYAMGETEGTISKEPRGKNGFGFDSIFEVSYPTDSQCCRGRYSGLTLAELPTREKHRISSRKRALVKLIKAGAL